MIQTEGPGAAQLSFMYFMPFRGSMLTAQSTPPIIAPMTPTVVISLPEKYSPLIGERGRSQGVAKR